jgi:hypothetical protein
MKEEKLVELLMGDLTREGTFPINLLSRVNVVGGRESVRDEVIKRLSDAYPNCKFGTDIRGGYGIVLASFIRKYDESYCGEGDSWLG